MYDHIFNWIFPCFCPTVRRLGWSSTALLHMTATGNWPMQRQRRQSHGHVVILVKETSRQRGKNESWVYWQSFCSSKYLLFSPFQFSYIPFSSGLSWPTCIYAFITSLVHVTISCWHRLCRIAAQTQTNLQMMLKL